MIKIALLHLMQFKASYSIEYDKFGRYRSKYFCQSSKFVTLSHFFHENINLLHFVHNCEVNSDKIHYSRLKLKLSYSYFGYLSYRFCFWIFITYSFEILLTK